MSDLVKRLREGGGQYGDPYYDEAADAIERAEAEAAKLRALLRLHVVEVVATEPRLVKSCKACAESWYAYKKGGPLPEQHKPGCLAAIRADAAQPVCLPSLYPTADAMREFAADAAQEPREPLCKHGVPMIRDCFKCDDEGHRVIPDAPRDAAPAEPKRCPECDALMGVGEWRHVGCVKGRR